MPAVWAALTALALVDMLGRCRELPAWGVWFNAAYGQAGTVRRTAAFEAERVSVDISRPHDAWCRCDEFAGLQEGYTRSKWPIDCRRDEGRAETVKVNRKLSRGWSCVDGGLKEDNAASSHGIYVSSWRMAGELLGARCGSIEVDSRKRMFHLRRLNGVQNEMHDPCREFT